MRQTTVTNDNRAEFYKNVYPVLRMDKNSLINLSHYKGTKILLDCAGWHYQTFFPQQQIIKLENIQTCKNYSLTKQQFDIFYKDDHFPSISNVDDGILILDHSQVLKYKTVPELKQLLTELSCKIKTNEIILRVPLITMGDDRLTDRFLNLCNIIPDNFVAIEISYTLKIIFMHLKKKKEYDFN